MFRPIAAIFRLLQFCSKSIIYMPILRGDAEISSSLRVKISFFSLFSNDDEISVSPRNTGIYRVSQEECARLWEGVPYVKVYRYNPKHLCPKLNGYGDNGQRKVWSSCGSTQCTCQLTILSISVLECGVILLQVSLL